MWLRASSFLRSKGDQTSSHERRTKSPRKWKTQLGNNYGKLSHSNSVFLILSLYSDRCISKHFRIVSKVTYSFQNDFLWKQDNSVIVLFYFSLLTLVCIGLEAGEVEVTLSHFSALLPYVFPVTCRPVVHFDLPPSVFV